MLPTPGCVPKTNPLNGRCVTVTGGDAEFIKKSIASGMLGSAEASKIQADVDTKKTGGMFLENDAEWRSVHSRCVGC